MIHVHNPLDVVLLYLQYSACMYLLREQQTSLASNGRTHIEYEGTGFLPNVRETEANVLFPLLTLLP